LNDPRNLELSIVHAKKAGMISQAAMCITHSPIHTIEYYVQLADKLVSMGTDELCLKDMAGIGRPAFLGKLTKALKDRHPNIKIQYHGHCGPGFSVASMLEVARAGADYLDVAMEPLSWGMVHPDVITIQSMLKEDDFLVPDINMDAYMEARRLTQSFIDDFLGLFIDPSNKQMTSLLVSCGLPGGMMGSMMADLKGMHNAINMALRQNGKPEVPFNELVVQLFHEVEYVWPKLGYPPLVTPFSQYVKNIALMNLFSLAKGESRFSQIDKDSWNMILGKMGQLPGPLAPEIIELVQKQGMEFYSGNPQDAYPDALSSYRAEMKANDWEVGQDEEELFELAMHDRQYRDYRSGLAKKRFEQELEQAREKAGAPRLVVRPVIEIPSLPVEEIRKTYPKVVPVQTPVGGQVIWQLDVVEESKPPVIGTKVDKKVPFCWIQTYYGLEPVYPMTDGVMIQIDIPQGGFVKKNQVLALIDPLN
jgi:pyruvate carboxylase subunit B